MVAAFRWSIWACLMSLLAACQGTPSSLTSMRLDQTAYAPPGYLEFCRRNAEVCADTTRATRVQLTDARWEQLREVQSDVNRSVRFVSDAAQYGQLDWWTYPGPRGGDCEDYVLEKQRRLIAMGWPRSSLVFATGMNEANVYHAVLVAVTDRGDFVLDNRRRSVEHWAELPYKWMLRQSQSSPRHWLRIASGAVPAATGTAAQVASLPSDGS